MVAYVVANVDVLEPEPYKGYSALVPPTVIEHGGWYVGRARGAGDAKILEGDFEPGPWPAHFEDEAGAVVIGGMRGVAIPENSPNLDDAIAFAQFMLSVDAQAASLEHIGASVRGDFDVAGASDNRMFFVQPEHRLAAYDFPESVHPFYPELEAEYHRILLSAIDEPPADWQAFISETAETLRGQVAEMAN